MSSRSTSRKPDPKGERVQKVLAQAGLGSRRQLEQLIAAGRVLVNGRPAVLGDRITGLEKILVDGKPIAIQPPNRDEDNEVLLYHKPAGEVTTRRDPERRDTVFDGLPRARRGRWIVIGRLDFNTSGLLLFTTDGELAHRLTHPSFEIAREYAVRVRGELTEQQLDALLTGVELDDGPASLTMVTPMQKSGTNAWYRVELREGRNREIRRMFEAIGVPVSRLIRLRFGPIELGRIRRGSYRPLEPAEIDALYAAVR